MRFFYVAFLFALIDALWWRAARRLAARSAAPQRWRRVADVTAALAGLGLGLLLFAKIIGLRVMIMPEIAVIATFLWHFIVGPVTLVLLALALAIGAWFRPKASNAFDPEMPLPRRGNAPDSARISTTTIPEESGALPGRDLALGTVATQPLSLEVITEPATLSRRSFLYGGLVALPPLTVTALTAQSRLTQDDLIRRDIDLPIPNLPAALDGMTVAHFSDPHLGSFITDRKVKKIIEMTNEMDADLVLQTGHLINQNLGDLPDGIELMRQLRGRYGVYSCQGNHDCIESRDTFEADTKRAGLNMLIDESAVVTVRGHRVRLLGPRWWGSNDDVIAWSVNQLLPATPDDAFNILMAHHPHAFDPAVAAGIPLTLSGHTHGGQIRLTQNIGVGPLMYRYWSGVYTRPNAAGSTSTTVINNGTGNWFPLRINVPCEVLKLTLRRV